MAKQTKQKTGVMGQISGLVGRGAGRARTGGGGLPGKAASFVSGFLSGGDQRKRGRGARSGRAARGGRAGRGARRRR